MKTSHLVLAAAAAVGAYALYRRSEEQKAAASNPGASVVIDIDSIPIAGIGDVGYDTMQGTPGYSSYDGEEA